jgi:hypothetical protein
MQVPNDRNFARREDSRQHNASEGYEIHMHVCKHNGLERTGCNWSWGFVGWKLEQSEGDRKLRQDTKLKATGVRTRRMRTRYR